MIWISNISTFLDNFSKWCVCGVHAQAHVCTGHWREKGTNGEEEGQGQLWRQTVSLPHATLDQPGWWARSGMEMRVEVKAGNQGNLLWVFPESESSTCSVGHGLACPECNYYFSPSREWPPLPCALPLWAAVKDYCILLLSGGISVTYTYHKNKVKDESLVRPSDSDKSRS